MRPIQLKKPLKENKADEEVEINQEDQERKDRIQELGLFRTMSFIERKYGEPVAQNAQLKKLVKTE